MTQYGVCSWIFGEESLGRTVERVAKIGYDGVELMGDLKRFQPDEVNTVMAEHGLRVLSITPENEDILHPDPVKSETGQQSCGRIGLGFCGCVRPVPTSVCG